MDSTTPWKEVQPVAKQLPTRRISKTQNTRTQTSVRRLGFEPTTPVFERAKTVHVSDVGTTVIVLNFLFLTPIPDSDMFKTPEILVVGHGNPAI
jgi:hypothetical protein